MLLSTHTAPAPPQPRTSLRFPTWDAIGTTTPTGDVALQSGSVEPLSEYQTPLKAVARPICTSSPRASWKESRNEPRSSNLSSQQEPDVVAVTVWAPASLEAVSAAAAAAAATSAAAAALRRTPSGDAQARQFVVSPKACRWSLRGVPSEERALRLVEGWSSAVGSSRSSNSKKVFRLRQNIVVPSIFGRKSQPDPQRLELRPASGNGEANLEACLQS
mmetsp:Transcript_3843/g.11670  ORF Transcript_3843/g.11670 Transcript_3843/m.11670 type:complete len:218 (+) Transcript_3843:988-1641(+)